jgi:hypothetical protein
VPANRLALCQDSQHGFILVGPHLPEGKPPRVRAYSLKNAAVAWQALQGEDWLDQLNEIMSIGRLLFISIRSRIQCFDLISGREWWTMTIPSKFQLNPSGAMRGPKIYDATVNGQALLLAKTAGNIIIAFDPTTGQETGRRSFPSPVDLEMVEGNQVAVVRYNAISDKEKGVLEFVTPSTLQSVGGIIKGVAQDAIIPNAWTGGSTLAANVDKWGLLGAKGVAVFDIPSRRELYFEREKGLETSIHPVFWNNRVYYVTQAQEIRATPGPARFPMPIAGCRVAALSPVGNALFVGIEDMSGNAQVISVDPSSMQMRMNFGMLSSWLPTARLSNREPGRFFSTWGSAVAFISPSQDGAQEGELTVVDGNTSSILWQRPLPDCWPVEDFYMSGGAVVVWSTKNLLILDAMSGETIGVYPPQ